MYVIGNRVLAAAIFFTASSLSGCGGTAAAQSEASAAAPAKSSASPVAQQPAAQKPVAAPAQSKATVLTLADLTARRDLWPAKVALTKAVPISRTASLAVGKEVALDELLGAKIHIDTGKDLIECPSASTDVLERANAYVATLTAEQLALNEAVLPTRSDLWPLTVTLTRAFPFDNGKSIPVGRELVVRSFEGNQLKLYDRQLATWFLAEMHETDVFARARERLKSSAADRSPFFVRSIAAAVEPATPANANFEKADFVLVYRARLGCERCAAFAPALKSFCDRMKTEHPNLEAVFFSDDHNADDAKAVIAKEQLPGRALAFDKRVEAADLESHSGQLLPLVFLYDRTGKLVAQNDPNGGSPSATDILAVVEKTIAAKR